MIDPINYFFFILLILIINPILKKYNFLINNTGQKHQTFTFKEKVPLSGGLFILLFFYLNLNLLDLKFLVYFTLFFLIGLIADLNIIKSPLKRFFFQLVLLIIFIYDVGIVVNDIRIDFLNELLKNLSFNIFFVLFCFLVFLNGANFIDGNNGLSIGYFSIILFLLMKLIDYQSIYYEKYFLLSFFLFLLILLFFNLLNKFYLGDNGIYILVVFFGYLLTDIYVKNNMISPYFIVNMLWYPAFETLFSIVRKLKYKNSPMQPDTLHLHQLIFKYLSNKINTKDTNINSITGISINIYNLLILSIASINIFETNFQIICIFISLFIYLLTYFLLNKKKRSFKK